MRTRLRVLGITAATAVAAVAVPLVTSSSAHAGGFTGGNLVVYRVGDGSSALTNAAAPVFLDEFSPGGAKVQSVPLPTTATEGNLPLTATGQSRSEGLLDRSADGRFLVVTGYDAAPGTEGQPDPLFPGVQQSLTTTSPTAVPRVIGLVDANGTVDTTTKLGSAGTAKIIRSATATNGERLWATGGNGGVVTATRGSSTSTTVAGGASSNLSSLTVQGNQLFSSGILQNRLATVGSGVPTSGSLTDVTDLPDNLLTYGYAFADLTAASFDGTGLDTLYIADASSRAGTIDKYRWDGSHWSTGVSVDVPGAFGVVADVQGGQVSLAVTTPTQLITLTDSTSAATTFTPVDRSVLANAAANEEFRGVALAPTAATAGPSAFIRSPGVGSTVVLGGTVPVTTYAATAAGADVDSVQAKLGSGSYVSATKTGHVWTAQVPTTGLTAGASTVTVKATDGTGTTTASRSVTLSGTAVPPAGTLAAGTHAWTVKQVKLKGTWSTYKTKHSPTGKGRTSTKKSSTATAKVWGHGLVLTFDRSARAGKVKVTVDGKSTTLDLYSKAGTPLSKTWTFSGALKTHTVVVTVLGKKNTHSKGTAALLAALKVKS